MKCPHCQKDISDGAQACPYCRKNIKDNRLETTVESQGASPQLSPLPKQDSLPENLSALWQLSDTELASAYHSSVVLRLIGMILYLLPLLFFLPCVFSPKSIIGCFYLIVFYVPFLYPTAYVLRNVRSITAQKRLSHIAVFSAICGGITIAFFFILVLINAAKSPYRAGFIAGSMLIVILGVVLVLYTHRHIKNKFIFSNNPFSHAELKFVMDNRKQFGLGSKEYPAKYTYGKLAKTAMFFCPLMYFLALVTNFTFIEQMYLSLKGGESRISLEDIQYAEDCVKNGIAAADANDFQTAVDYFEKAAKLGHPEARLHLGVIYANGLAGTTDYEKAFNLLSNDEIIVSPMAKFYVGGFYYMGRGTQQDFKLAGKYLMESAQAGFKPAQDFLGYKNGKEPDYGMPLEDALKHLWETRKKDDGNAH